MAALAALYVPALAEKASLPLFPLPCAFPNWVCSLNPSFPPSPHGSDPGITGSSPTPGPGVTACATSDATPTGLLQRVGRKELIFQLPAPIDASQRSPGWLPDQSSIPFPDTLNSAPSPGHASHRSILPCELVPGAARSPIRRVNAVATLPARDGPSVPSIPSSPLAVSLPRRAHSWLGAGGYENELCAQETVIIC